ncbi:uncharacterized protein LOC129909310 [Episyrphus balteatus]|uniref:uncharacterized protein LOC129909310 n=1 Tax=Episyrphus balteatus TaxID=286459 RepID=UPI002485A6CB|nr:uncharacterized protein LOC129909310 [Episyrphus balteatus]
MSGYGENMCRMKKFAMEKKMVVLAKIREHKDILFGVFSDTLTKQIKSDKWKEVYDVARSINIVSASKDWTYVRDTFWQNCRKYTFIKIENSKKEGGKKCQLTQCDKIVLDIVGRESTCINGIHLEEPTEVI